MPFRLICHPEGSCRLRCVSPSAWPQAQTAQDPSLIPALPRSTPTCRVWRVRVACPSPAFLSPGSFFAHQPFSFRPFQVQLYVWHLLPLGKDLLHRVPTVLQAGGYPLQLPWSRVAGRGPGAWVCALERQPQGPGCPWMTGQQRQVSGQEDPAPGPPVGFPFTARHPLPDLLGMREHWRGVLRGTLAGAPGMSDAAPEQEVVPDTCSLHPSLSVCVRVRGSAWRF